MDGGEAIEQAYNLGSGTGTSVGEMMAAISRITGVDFVPEIGPRRVGDPARVVASGAKAGRDIDWLMRFSLDDMIRSAYEARANLPKT
jgi:UDP-glucose 4-epimerase